MIQKDKERRAIKIIQDLIIIGRSMAYQNKESSYIAEFLDKVELLPGLILEEKDRTDFFERYLMEICDTYGCEEVITRNRI